MAKSRYSRNSALRFLKVAQHQGAVCSDLLLNTTWEHRRHVVHRGGAALGPGMPLGIMDGAFTLPASNAQWSLMELASTCCIDAAPPSTIRAANRGPSLVLGCLQPEPIESAAIQAWYMDDSAEDQRLPHR